MFRKLLLPVDLSDRHQPALNVAIELAGPTGEVMLLHVIEVIPGLDLEEDKAFYAHLEKAARIHLERLGAVLVGQPHFLPGGNPLRESSGRDRPVRRRSGDRFDRDDRSPFCSNRPVSQLGEFELQGQFLCSLSRPAGEVIGPLPPGMLDVAIAQDRRAPPGQTHLKVVFQA